MLIIMLSLSAAGIPVLAGESRDLASETSKAICLKQLGLFRGVSDSDFALERKPSRIEAIVMLIRLLGKESEALSKVYSHPFVDTPEWADPYIGYAFATGLSNGISENQFGNGEASAASFLTFVLRALGYSDKNGTDFMWDSPFALAKAVGILTDEVNTVDFLRADVATVSFNALSALIKNTSISLSTKLISEGVFSEDQYNTIIEANSNDTRNAAMTAAEIFSKCSPSVVYIETFGVDGEPYARGSGVIFESSGLAITNYHVLENALSATATVSNGVTYDISGIVGFNREEDFAIIQIDGTDFFPMKIGNSNLLTIGEKIFTIGNPLGLTSTISDGLISNLSRAGYDGMIQITAPISHGSSGGAMINEHGELVGITTAGISSGQNLNFAIPINKIVEEYNSFLPLRTSPYSTFEEHAAYIAYIDSLTIPTAFQEVYNESEPNDIYQQAIFIQNGMSIAGKIDDGNCDLFPIRCNTTGSIDVILFSDSLPLFVQDLMLVLIDKRSDEPVAISSYFEFDDGTAAQAIQGCRIDSPGIYIIEILSYTLYEKYNLNTDYKFYYKFSPDYPS